ncbi:HAD domain-containing protein [Erythrobacter aureus]|uniref:HAD family hydrolase n=1 Tax=Erythrobacter aureus TaxID=2182384 RepID=A0A345YJ14_9SPHN|nr:HAD domain-containing protein [Erythrobacter aureus]AXK43916.1 hypothetical protein DVR09_15795 [Erythrobacter aureus]
MIIYLDIDGVLIPRKAHRDVIPARFAARLVRLLQSTRASLVITSTRRRSPDDLLSLLSNAGIARSALYQGPAGWMTALDLDDLDDDLSIRGQEIADHIDRAQPARFVILDDFPVLAQHQPQHIQPDEDVGITDAHIDQAITLLTVG